MIIIEKWIKYISIPTKQQMDKYIIFKYIIPYRTLIK